MDKHGRFPLVGLAHCCSLAAVACGPHRGYQAGHPEVFPYSAGYDPAMDTEELLERDDELGVLGTLVAQAARLRMPSRASHPAHPQQLRLPNQRLLSRDANITYNEGNSVSGAPERTVMHRTLPPPAEGHSRADQAVHDRCYRLRPGKCRVPATRNQSRWRLWRAARVPGQCRIPMNLGAGFRRW